MLGIENRSPQTVLAASLYPTNIKIHQDFMKNFVSPPFITPLSVNKLTLLDKIFVHLT